MAKHINEYVCIKDFIVTWLPGSTWICKSLADISILATKKSWDKIKIDDFPLTHQRDRELILQSKLPNPHPEILACLKNRQDALYDTWTSNSCSHEVVGKFNWWFQQIAKDCVWTSIRVRVSWGAIVLVAPACSWGVCPDFQGKDLKNKILSWLWKGKNSDHCEICPKHFLY